MQSSIKSFSIDIDQTLFKQFTQSANIKVINKKHYVNSIQVLYNINKDLLLIQILFYEKEVSALQDHYHQENSKSVDLKQQLDRYHQQLDEVNESSKALNVENTKLKSIMNEIIKLNKNNHQESLKKFVKDLEVLSAEKVNSRNNHSHGFTNFASDDLNSLPNAKLNTYSDDQNHLILHSDNNGVLLIHFSINLLKM